MLISLCLISHKKYFDAQTICMKQQNFIVGSLILALASFLAKVIGAVYRIPLTYILGAEGLGLYQMIFPLYSTLLVLCSTGVPNAIAKIVASGSGAQNRAVVRKSLLFFAGISLFMSLALALLSKPIANLQGNANAWLVYVGIAPAIFFVGVLSVFRGYFQGKQNILPTSISLIIEQLFKLIFGLLFASLCISHGLMFGAFGAVLGVTFSEIFALLAILIQYLLQRKETQSTYENISVKSIVKTTIPMTLSSMIMPLTLLIDSFLIINLLKRIGYSTSTATNMYGILTGVVNSLINLPVVLSMAVATMVIPIISKLYSNNKAHLVAEKSTSALRLVLFIALPCAVAFLVFPKDIIFFLFKNGLKVGAIDEFRVASDLLRIGAFAILFISLVQVATTILQSIDKTKIPIYNMVGACFLKVALTLVLVVIPSINIYGAMWSTLACYAVCAILDLQSLSKCIKIKLSLQYDIFLPVLACVMMATSMYSIKQIIGGGFIQTMTMFLVGGAMYLLIILTFNYGRSFDKQTIAKFIRNIKTT